MIAKLCLVSMKDINKVKKVRRMVKPHDVKNFRTICRDTTSGTLFLRLAIMRWSGVLAETNGGDTAMFCPIWRYRGKGGAHMQMPVLAWEGKTQCELGMK